MRQIRKSISDRVRRFAKLDELSEFVTRDVVPLLNTLRDAVNSSAPCGFVVFTDLEVNKNVAFETPERDAEYVVGATVNTMSAGAPRLCACVDNRKTSGFAVYLSGAPGPGESVTVGWSIRR